MSRYSRRELAYSAASGWVLVSLWQLNYIHNHGSFFSYFVMFCCTATAISLLIECRRQKDE